MIFDIDAQVILGSDTDLSSYVISYTRTHSMCNVSHIGEIKLSPNVVDSITINVYDPIRIIEYGTTVMTGYVSRISKNRSPAFTVSVFFSDKYKRAKDYYIDDPNWSTNGETLGDMFGQLCDLCGLEHTIDDGTGSVVLPPGQPLGLSTVDGTLQQLVAYATGVIYTGGDGVVHLRRGPRSSNLSFTTGETLPKVDYLTSGWLLATLPENITQGNVFEGTVLDSDENARDRAVVWGYAPYNRYRPDADLRIVAEDSVGLGLPVTKTIVYSSSLIQTQAEANRLAHDIISEVGKLDEVVTLECQGNPHIEILNNAAVDINLEVNRFTKTKKITTVSANVSSEGYRMTVTFDEFCPKFAGWALASLPTIIYAGTVRHGVYRSLDEGITWSGYNTGLTTAGKYVLGLATTDIDEVMAIINGGIWYTSSSGLTIENPAWIHRYPSAIISGLDQEYVDNRRYVAVRSAGQAAGQFNVLATSSRNRSYTVSGTWVVQRPESRTWVYNTVDAGVHWTGTLICDGDDMDFYGLEMSSRYSTPYIITTRSSLQYGALPVRVQKGTLQRFCYHGRFTGGSHWDYTEEDPQELGVKDFELYTHLGPGNPYIPSEPGTYGPSYYGVPNKRAFSFPIYIKIDKPLDPSIELTSVQVYWQYSFYGNPIFSELRDQQMIDAYGEWQYQNWINLMGFGNIAQPKAPAYQNSYGDIDMTFHLRTYINAYEWEYDPYRLWGDGMSGSVGICFIATYKYPTEIPNPNWPGHFVDNYYNVTTGYRHLSYYESSHGAQSGLQFTAGVIFWEFI